MSNITKLKQQLEESQSLKLVTGALGEVAALKVKATREQIQHNSLFFSQIGWIYHQLKLIAAKRRQLKKKPELHTLTSNLQTVSILITSNSQFYGGLDSKLVEYFLTESKKNPTAKIVIGITGNKLLSSEAPKDWQEFILHQDLPSSSEMKKIVDMVKNYNQVLVYHSKFASVLDQVVTVTNVKEEETAQEVQNLGQLDYILEPELSKMLEFFDRQILSSLLQAIFLEAQLSRTASRMVGMDQAELNADKEISIEKLVLTRSRRGLQNLRTLEALPAILRKEDGR